MAPFSPRSAEELEVARHLERNYWAHSLEGGLFAGAVAFVNPQTVLPRMIERLGGPNWAIAAAPVLLLIGFSLPSLFLTHRLEQLRRLKGFVLLAGVFQRVPYVAVGVTLLVLGQPGKLALWLVVSAPLLAGLAGGVSVSAWREYVAKTIPPERRASLWAMRFVLGALLGGVAAHVVSRVLERYPAALAYGLLHMGVFTLMLASFGMFALTREPDLDSARPQTERSWWSYARAMRQLIASDAALRRYLACRALNAGLYVALPFVALHALEVLRAPDAFLGELLMFQMGGTVLGNLTAGVVGDRYGGRLVVLLSQASSAIVVLSALLAHTPLAFELSFMGLGVALGLGAVGVPTLDFELSDYARRMSYQTLIASSQLIGMLSAVCIATLGRHYLSFSVLAWISAAAMLGAFALLAGLPEPRQRGRRWLATAPARAHSDLIDSGAPGERA